MTSSLITVLQVCLKYRVAALFQSGEHFSIKRVRILSIINDEMRQKIIIKALSDPVFRRMLMEQPASALEVKELDIATLADVYKILYQISNSVKSAQANNPGTGNGE